MSLELIKKITIIDESLEKLFIEKVGDAEKDIFIEVDSYLKEIIDNNILEITNDLKLGECEINGVKSLRKLGIVYLSDKNLDFFNKSNRINSIVPSLKYSKDEIETTSKEYITEHGQYKLTIKANNIKMYDFIIVSYVECL